MEPILKAQFAARLKVSKARVTQMVQMGMPTTPEGKINVPDALAWIEEHIDSSHQRSRGQRAAAAGAPDAAAPPEARVPQGAGVPPNTPMPPLAAPAIPRDGLPDPGRILLSAKAKKALVDLRKAEREERKENGELLEVAEVTAIIEDLVMNAKTKLLAVGYRLGPVLAIEHDANKCTALVDGAIREALEELVAYKVAA